MHFFELLSVLLFFFSKVMHLYFGEIMLFKICKRKNDHCNRAHKFAICKSTQPMDEITSRMQTFFFAMNDQKTHASIENDRNQLKKNVKRKLAKRRFCALFFRVKSFVNQSVPPTSVRSGATENSLRLQGMIMHNYNCSIL